MDAFQGCLNDGTNGTRDCRRFAAVYPGIAYVLYFLYATVATAYFLPLAAIVHILVSALHNIKPYKLAYYNHIGSCMFLLLALYCILGSAAIQASTHAPTAGYATSALVLFAILGTLPQLYITGVLGHWLIYKISGKSISCTQMTCGNASVRFEETLPDRMVNPEEYEELTSNPIEDENDGEELFDNTAY